MAARRAGRARLEDADPARGAEDAGRSPTSRPSRAGAVQPRARRSRGAALARRWLGARSPPGNPTGSLPDWPGSSGPDLHFNGKEGSLRFENGFWGGSVALHSPLHGPRVLALLRGPKHTRSVPLPIQSERCLNYPPPIVKCRGIQKQNTNFKQPTLAFQRLYS